MLRAKYSYLIVALALLIFSSVTRAQFLWHVAHSDQVNQYHYSFTNISCQGQNCIAAALQSNDSSDYPRIILLRSTNSGLSWDEINPTLDFFGITQTKISSLQQIDLLNIVAVGDSGLVIRSFDGGNTWEKQDCQTRNGFTDVHFSNKLIGIIVGHGADSNIYTTIDGGKNWVLAHYGKSYTWQCHSNGNGRFSIFKYGHGPVYSTTNNWKTMDSSSVIFDSVSDPEYKYVFTHCNFSITGDTMIAYGVHWPPDGVQSPQGPAMARSIDAGAHWQLINLPLNRYVQTTTMTPIFMDTILASGDNLNSIYFSTDRGATWRIDTVLLDTSYQPSVAKALTMTGDGHPIAIFSNNPLVLGNSILARGELSKSHIERYERIVYNTHITPNPVSKKLNISTIEYLRPVYIFDVLGREALRGKTDDQGIATFDVSRLPIGMFTLIINHDGNMITVGKFMTGTER